MVLKIGGQVGPGSDARISDDLDLVVIDESVAKTRKIEKKRGSENQ
jgi:hypothetical protein